VKESTIVNCWRKADILINNNDYIVEFSENDLEALTKIENSLNKNIEFKQKNTISEKNYHLNLLIFII